MSSLKSYVTLKEKYDRVVVLIDMDCFYCQVEEFLDPERLSGKPIGEIFNNCIQKLYFDLSFGFSCCSIS